jgi:hypothetical protein
LWGYFIVAKSDEIVKIIEEKGVSMQKDIVIN